MKNAFVERDLSRWMRPDAHRFVRPDWQQHVQEDSELAAVLGLYEQKYRPDQPRVPAGSREGGQWTYEGGASPVSAAANKPSIGAPGITDRRVLSDAGPEPSYIKPGAKIAARISQSREEECEMQYRKDTFICNLVRTQTCWAQAMFRRAQCIRGGYIPPLYH